jgi:hypothetical protein
MHSRIESGDKDRQTERERERERERENERTRERKKEGEREGQRESETGGKLGREIVGTILLNTGSRAVEIRAGERGHLKRFYWGSLTVTKG